MGAAHIGLVHHDPCRCKVKGFRTVSFIKRNVSKRHLQEVRCRKALDMYRSPHITIPCLLRGEQGDLEDKSQG